MGFLDELVEGFGKLVGSIVGISSVVIAKGLGITSEMVDKAKDAGCESYEEIRNFFDLDK